MEEQERDPREEVAKIFTSAGWTAGTKDGWDGRFVWRGDAVVGGIDACGVSRVAGLTSPDGERPDLITAAHWLVEHAKQHAPNPLTTEATLEPLALQSEEVETPRTYDAATAEYFAEYPDESNGETGEVAGDGEASPGVVFEPGFEGGPERVDLRHAEPDASAIDEAPIDADFTEGEDLGAELLDAHDLILEGGDPCTAPELPAPEPEDFAPDEFAPEPEAPQDRFIGLDDLDRVRSLRIGDVATEALRLTAMIEQAVSEQEDEFASIQAYVVSNLDKHTGAFTPQDDAARKTYGRFLELSSARSKIARIDACRKDATALLLRANRDDVVSFDVQAAFA